MPRRPAPPPAARVRTFALAALAALAGACRPAAPPPVSADIVGLMSGPAEGYARALGPTPIALPADEGPHPAYRTEWWYYTGHLFARAEDASGRGADGRRGPAAGPSDGAEAGADAPQPPWLAEADAGGRRRFGFQLTFFRSTLAPPPDGAASDVPAESSTATATVASAWTTDQAYLAHFTVTDVAAGRFHSAERLARGALGLAGAAAAPYRVWVGPWSAAAGDGAGGHAGTGGVRLRAADGPVAIDVTLRPVKAPARHGRDGLSRKGPGDGNASYYYSYTRLAATGVVTTAAGSWPVEGGAWMDHEWSTSALAADRTGWDWFSLQLDDGTDLMAFQIRDAAGRPAPESSGSLVDRTGGVETLAADDFTIAPRGAWRSPRTGARYPSGWRLTAPAAGIDLVVTPLADDQELSTGFRYWEGAVTAAGTAGGRPIRGRGYVELTGYAAPLGASASVATPAPAGRVTLWDARAMRDAMGDIAIGAAR